MIEKIFNLNKQENTKKSAETIVISKKILYVTGLPRSGSTLLCQLLGTHQQIYSIGHSSPLCPLIENMRHNLSDNPFLLSQLDVEYDLVYHRMLNGYRGFINGWFAEAEKPVVADKNRGWLGMIETVSLLDPDFRMIICLRDPVQIFGSIEAQHRKTVLLDFPDHLPQNSIYARADMLFKNEGVVGGPLRSVQNLQDIMDEEIKKKIFYMSFEALVHEPVKVMEAIFSWAGLPQSKFDPGMLPVKPHESDSYYRYKYTHKTHPAIRPPEKHKVSERISREIVANFKWYYENFYPDHYPEWR